MKKKIDVTLSNGTPYKLYYADIDSGKEGPCVLITAAMHGNELQGSEALCRMLPLIDRDIKCGRCVAVPFANPIAIRKHQPHIDFEIHKYYGSDKRDNLNCSWPGKKDGSSAERLSYVMANSIVSEATHMLDLHCWNHTMAAAALVKKNDEEGEMLAKNTGLRFGRRFDCHKEPPHTLADLFFVSNRPSVTIEFSGQYGFWKNEVASAEKAILGYLAALGMLNGVNANSGGSIIWVDENEPVDIKAPCDGVFVPAELDFSVCIEKGSLLGYIRDMNTFEEQPVEAPEKGYLYWFKPMQKEEWENSRTFHHPCVKKDHVVASIVITRHV